jgi:hypothetical protein
MLDYNLKKLAIQLMVRDITTTYNVWNIDEKEYKIADVPGQNQELPESGLQHPKPKWDFQKIYYPL